MTLDLEVDHAPHDHVADGHPEQRAPEHDTRAWTLTDLAVEVRRDQVDDHEHRERGEVHDHRPHPALRREALDLPAHLEALSDHLREVVEDLAQVSAGA